jgi:hypothetical protein
MKIFWILALSFISPPVFASNWEIKFTSDAMTDKESTEAFIISNTGERFTILRRSDGRFWGYIQLVPPNQFSINERLITRIDKNTPKEFNEDFEKLTKSLGSPIESWEWNPSLIGFGIWHGNKNEGCGWLRQLYDGKKFIIRYHLNKSTTRDVIFELSGSQEAISKAAGFDVSMCPESKN